MLEDGVRFSRAEFSAARLEATTEQASQASGSGSLELVLDDQSPRPLLAANVALSSIVDEDRELSAGWHVLVAFIATPAQIDLYSAQFQLELGLERKGHEAACALLAPRGTLHQAPNTPVELVAAPLVPGVTRFEYFVASEPPVTLRTRGLESASAAGLASGDHRVGVRCYDEGGVLVGQTERTVTINADEEATRP